MKDMIIGDDKVCTRCGEFLLVKDDIELRVLCEKHAITDELLDTLKELVDIVDNTDLLDIDRFTTQPAHALLAKAKGE